jgi:hypothetical protein
MWTWALWLACSTEPDVPAGPDLVTPPAAGAAVAGTITDEASLFGGVAAEGRVGDILIANAVARFVIQGVRQGSYYIPEGGGVIDADVQRPPGAPGRDVIDEWMPILGVGRIVEPSLIEIVADGREGGAAVVRVYGEEVALGLVEGALEAPGFVPSVGVDVVTTYTLAPDSPLLHVETTVTAQRSTVVAIGDVLLPAPEGGWIFTEGRGFDGGVDSNVSVLSVLGHQGDVAVALLPASPAPLQTGPAATLAAITPLLGGYAPAATLAAGASATHARFYGVAPTLSTLTDAALVAQGVATQAVQGRVTAPDGPVAGAWVHVAVDGAPWSMARTDTQGNVAASAPADRAVTLRALGEAGGLRVDLADGSGRAGPYAAASANATARSSYTAQDLTALPEGRGLADPTTPLVLGVPATLTVEAGDSLPFTFWVRCPDAAEDRVWVPGHVGGRSATGFARDGTLALPVTAPPEGVDCAWVAHRGMRHEAASGEVRLAAGQTAALTVALPAAYSHPGWLLGDPHSHAAPSGDADIPMEDRLITEAAAGVQLHFGTDHDHIVDYTPLLAPLGLSEVLGTVVADEVSPPLRGHFNLWPLLPDLDAPDGGAWLWWIDIPTSTEGMIDTLRSQHGDLPILQSNHPTDKGVASAAGWDPGVVDDPSRFTTRMEATEVINSGAIGDFLDFFFDLTKRGHRVAPVGVSDAHGWLDGHLGLSSTFFHVGLDQPSALTPERLAATTRASEVVASRGVFLDLSIAPGATLQPGASLTVSAKSPSWIQVDRLRLLRDGLEVASAEGTTTTFSLQSDRDAVFHVIAEGDRPMAPVDDRTPWAITGTYWFDADGGGYTSTLDPLPTAR